MLLKSVNIKNFRLLKNVIIKLDDKSTLIVGKNNSGKTSFSEIFRIFMGSKSFSFDDFSIETHKTFFELYKMYQNIDKSNEKQVIEDLQRNIPRISLELCIEYSNNDNWNNLRPLLTSLSDESEIRVLFEYSPDSVEGLLKSIPSNLNVLDDTLSHFRKSYLNSYRTKIFPISDGEKGDPLSLKEIQDLIKCNFISAQRSVDDSNSDSSSKLSTVFQKHFECFLNKKEEKLNDINNLETSIEKSNTDLDVRVGTLFNGFVSSLKTFGFSSLNDSDIELKSVMDSRKLLDNNVKLFYKNSNSLLPEKYNGLGFSNLIYILSLILGFFFENKKQKRDLNLIFIEEPEAHMHPQMQSVFIKNITKFLKKEGYEVQLIISTHSSYILSDSDFKCIRYFNNIKNHLKVKDLIDFSPSNDSSNTIRFLKQYLTLTKCDLFFADKAILIEGVVERLLMPVFFNKLYKSNEINSLDEQYVSVLEIGGAYMNKFKELLEFLEIKALIITDIDCVKPTNSDKTKKIVYTKSEIKDDKDLVTSNITLKQWIPKKENLIDLLKVKSENKIEGKLKVVYQTNVSSMATIPLNIKCGRSFEEAFLIDNSKYIYDNKDNLFSIRNSRELRNTSSEKDVFNDSYKIYEFIDRNNKKTEFAFDLINIQQDNWSVPEYIKEGLIWLAK